MRAPDCVTIALDAWRWGNQEMSSAKW